MTNQGKFCVTAIRSGASIFGAAMAPVKEHGTPMRFETSEAAWAYADRLMAGLRTNNVRYVADSVDCWPGVFA